MQRDVTGAKPQLRLHAASRPGAPQTNSSNEASRHCRSLHDAAEMWEDARNVALRRVLVSFNFIPEGPRVL